MLGVSGGVVKVCDDKCGCSVPCLGDVACRCSNKESEDHKKCSCGEHCGCNPCTNVACSLSSSAAADKPLCNCPPACTCVACAV